MVVRVAGLVPPISLDSRLAKPSVYFRGNHGPNAQVHGELAGRLCFMGPVHDQRKLVIRRRWTAKSVSSRRGIAPLAQRQRKGHGPPLIRGNQLNPGAAPAPGSSGELNGRKQMKSRERSSRSGAQEGTEWLEAGMPSGPARAGDRPGPGHDLGDDPRPAAGPPPWPPANPPGATSGHAPCFNLQSEFVRPRRSASHWIRSGAGPRPFPTLAPHQ